MNRAIVSGVGSAGGALLAVGVGTLVLSRTCIGVGRAISRQQRVCAANMHSPEGHDMTGATCIYPSFTQMLMTPANFKFQLSCRS
jgi:hypothetical protein